MRPETSFVYRLPGRPAVERRTFRFVGVDAEDHIFRQIASRARFYEIELLEYLASRVPTGGWFVDVGANIGNHAVFFGTFCADYVTYIEHTGAPPRWLRRLIGTWLHGRVWQLRKGLR